MNTFLACKMKSRLLQVAAYLLVVVSLPLAAATTLYGALTDGLQLHSTFDTTDIGGTYAGGNQLVNNDSIFDTAGPTIEPGVVQSTGTMAISTNTGIIGGALTLPGVDHEAISYGNKFNIGTGELTVSIWFNSSDLTTKTGYIVAHGADGSAASSVDAGYGFFTNKANSSLVFRFNNGLLGTSYVEDDITSTALQTNTWYFAAFTIGQNLDGTATITPYLDGSSAGFTTTENGTGGGTVPPDTLPAGYNITQTSPYLLFVGRRSTGGASATPFTGSVDDFSVWNRALSSSEVQQLYQAGLLGEDILSPLSGDINQDGHVDVADLIALEQDVANLSAYQTTVGAGTSIGIADINHDGLINNADIQALIGLLHSGGGSSSVVPEPASFVLLCLGGVMFFGVRFRKGSWIRALKQRTEICAAPYPV